MESKRSLIVGVHFGSHKGTVALSYSSDKRYIRTQCSKKDSHVLIQIQHSSYSNGKKWVNIPGAKKVIA